VDLTNASTSPREHACGPRRTRWALTTACAALLLASCGTRYQRVPVYEDHGIHVLLRAEIKGGERVDHGYAQPAEISGVRLAHVLARLDIRLSAAEDKLGERKPAIPTKLVYELGDLLSDALSKADSSQHVVVQAIRKERRLGVFTQSYLTSFIALVDSQNQLEIHLYQSDWLIPQGTDKDHLREPRFGAKAMKFRVVPADHMKVIGEQALAVDWRNPAFRRASNIRITPTGRVMRREVLMESPAPAAEEEPEQQAAPTALPRSPEALRALADLEEARRQGKVTEVEYTRRRAEILRGAR